MRLRNAHGAVRIATCLALVGSLLALCQVERAVATFPARLLVVSTSGVAPKIKDSVIAGLAQVGDVIAPREYAAAARDAGLSPGSAQALERVAPSLYARLIILLSPEGRGLKLSFRDGRDGAVVREVVLPLQHKTLARGSLHRVQQIALDVLSTLQAAPPLAAITPSAGSPLPPSAASAEPFAGEPTPEVEPIPQSVAATEARDAAGPFGASEASAPEADLPPSTSEPSASRQRMTARVALGPGVGARSLRTPSASGERSLATGLFPVLDVGIGADADLNEHVAFGVQAHYQTSLGLHATERELGTGQTKRTSLRSHRLDLGVLPAYRFASAPARAELGLFLGWGWRGLRSIVDINIPAYTLQGPVLRPELRIPIGGAAVVLRFAPELMLIAGVTDALRTLGGTARYGIAWGGEASLEIRLIAAAHLTLAYRESHASLSTGWGSTLSDSERFATASLVLDY
jgi:hypothetical protein